jgi:hypothetical protein
MWVRCELQGMLSWRSVNKPRHQLLSVNPHSTYMSCMDRVPICHGGPI